MARAIDTSTLPQETVEEALSFIAEGLRPADLAEVQATLGAHVDVRQSILDSHAVSTRSWLILDRSGLPIGAFGVAPHMVSKLGIAWLLGTEGMEREALSVGRQSRKYIAEMAEDFPLLWANVDARNELSMKWLEWAGFRITDANPLFGPQERLFIEFTRTP